MNIQIVSFVFGGLLIFVGVLGGGFELKELKVPKVGTGVRVLAAIVGLLFVCLGVGQADQDKRQASPAPVISNALPVVHASEPQEERPVDFVLSDQLGQGQVSEQVVVLIDGK